MGKVKYLGVIINQKCSWDEYNKDTWKNGVAELNKIRRICLAPRGCEYKLAQNMYRTLVESKILYAMEIWGEEKIGTIIDALKARFGKIWLKLPFNTANVAVSRELGMESGISILIKIIIKHYYYISSKENDELVKICWNYYIRYLDLRIEAN